MQTLPSRVIEYLEISRDQLRAHRDGQIADARHDERNDRLEEIWESMTPHDRHLVETLLPQLKQQVDAEGQGTRPQGATPEETP